MRGNPRQQVLTVALCSLVACGAHGGGPQAESGSPRSPGAGGSNVGASGSGASSGATSSGTASSGTVRASSGTASAGTVTASSGTATSGVAGAPRTWAPPSTSPVHFHWQLSTTFATSDLLSGQQGLVAYDIDGEGATAVDVAAIHAAGAKAICYVDVGTLEAGRSDYNQFPASVIGPVVAGWPQEKWLEVTAANQAVILPLMKARLTNWCQSKGFDAVEPDNLDAWTNVMGISEADNIAYDLAIAGLAHALDLSVGLKNTLSDADTSYVPSLTSTFDWALVEQCYEYSECAQYAQFISAGKAVWDVEYDSSPNCTQANGARMNAQLRDLNLAGPHAAGYVYTPCVPDSQPTW